MIGGFLGAGKTTCIARLAKHFTDEGKRIAIVTNDQAYDLVEKQLEYPVPDGCFSFDLGCWMFDVGRSSFIFFCSL